MISQFNTVGDYCRFVGAKEFTIKDESDTTFAYEKNSCERLGDFLVYPLLKPADFSISNSRHPLMIIALTIAALFVATMIFYPSVIAGIFFISGAIIKLSLFALAQMTVLGVGLRTLGRLTNPKLMSEWEKGNLNTQAVGTFRID